MKKRVFYVINLDRGRIITISFLFGAFICVSFISGFHLGTSKSGVPLYSSGGNVSYLNQNNYGLPVEKSSELSHDNGSQYGRSLTRISRDIEGENLETENDSETKESSLDEIKTLPDQSSKRKSETSSKKKKEAEKKPSSKKTAAKKSAGKKSEVKKITEKSSAKKSASNNKTITQKKKDPGSSNTKKNQIQKSPVNPKSPLLGSSDVKLSNVSSDKPAAASSGMSLQIGAFSDRGTAERMKSQLAADGFSAYIISGSNRHRVRVGRALNSEKTDSLEKQLKNKKYASYRIKE